MRAGPPAPLCARSVFVRPLNLTFSTILQTLAVARHLSIISRGRVVRIESRRDPEMQRHQNFITVTLDTNDTWTKLRNNPAAERVQVPLRYTLDRAEILNAERGRNQGVGLREIAPLIGLKLGSNLQPTKTGRTATTDSQIEEMDSTMTDPSKLMLADFDRRPEEMCTVGLKLVPRENQRPARRVSRPKDNAAAEEAARLETAIKKYFRADWREDS